MSIPPPTRHGHDQRSCKALREVCQYARRTAVLSSANEVLAWDERTQLPAAGGEHRAEQSTLLAGLIHQRWVDPKFGEQLEELSAARSVVAGLQPASPFSSATSV